jgi:hypothetical protein
VGKDWEVAEIVLELGLEIQGHFQQKPYQIFLLPFQKKPLIPIVTPLIYEISRMLFHHVW